MDVTIALIPILIVALIALVIITWLYFRSKEKQMMIEKGMSYEQMIEFMKSKRSPYTLLKIGLITIFFGFGLGIGLLIEVYTGIGEWIPFLLFAFTGAGFVVAFYAADKIEAKKNGNKT
jgi:hypothetical protein